MIFAVAAVGVTFASCSKSDLQAPDTTGKPNELPVQISLTPEALSGSFGPVSEASETKAAAKAGDGMSVVFGGEADTKSTTELGKADDSKVLNVWAIQFKADGTLLGNPYYTADIPAAGAGSSGIDATYSLSVNLTSNNETGGKVYFIANTNSPTFFNVTNAATETALKAVMQSIGTELKPTAASGIPMLGVYTGKVTSSATIGNVSMKRLMAKVILKYKVNTSFSGFEVTGVRLRNAAANIYFNTEPTGIFPAKNTTAGKESHIDYPAENLANAATDGDYKKFVWYVPENLRSVIAGITAVGDRILSKTDGMATYVEIKGTLKSSAKCEKATYNILLGDPATNKGDFNVKRNNVYTVTVDIQGTNIADKRITVESFDRNNSAMIVPNSGDAGAVTFDIRKLTSGWQTTMPALGQNAALRAEVLWSDVANIIKPADITLDKVNGLLTVKSSQNVKGNAVVALYNATSGGTILWSWHIWVTDYRPSEAGAAARAANSVYTVPGGQVHTYGTQFMAKNPGKVIMDRNLGALTAFYAAPGAIDNTNFGMFYQWGRKDPLPRWDGVGSTDAAAVTIKIYGPTGAVLGEGAKDNTTATGYKKVSVATAGSTGPNTLYYAVKNPLSFIYNAGAPYDWYTSTNSTSAQRNDLWGDGAAKSAYDPCPEGWRIAPNGTWSDFGTNAYAAPFWYWINGVQQTASGSPAFVQSGRNGRLYAAGSVKAWYPAPGYRERANGALGGVGNYGYSWASTVSGTYGMYLWFSTAGLYPSSAGIRAYGFQVRCLQE